MYRVCQMTPHFPLPVLQAALQHDSREDSEIAAQKEPSMSSIDTE